MTKMEVIETDSGAFENQLGAPKHAFNSTLFSLLNTNKVDEVHYLLFKDSKYRLGLIAGIVNNELKSPFSAPFGGFSYRKDGVTLQQIDNAVNALIEWTKANDIYKLSFVLPPTIYDESNSSKLINVFYRSGFEQHQLDLNYYFPLARLKQNYEQSLWKNARKNLRNALQNDLNFQICNTIEEKQLAYQIIKQNRVEKGYPLRMTWEQVNETGNIIQADFFLVMQEDNAIAAAIVFHITDKIVQVIYWGELVEYTKYRPMNLLAAGIFEHYFKLIKDFVDLGPSTEDSMPNYGLCDFKESIGCKVNIKSSWTYTVR